MCQVIAITNQKGGVGKTTTTFHLGIKLAQEGKRVLLIDADPQASLTASFGIRNADTLDTTLTNALQAIVEDEPIDPAIGIRTHEEGAKLFPANIELASFETAMINVMSREYIMREFVNIHRPNFDYILIDCMPSLGMLTVNALAAADSVIIPSQPSFLSAKGLDLLLHSVANGLPLNRAMRDDSGAVCDAIAGTAFLCDCSGERFGSLSEEQCRRYQRQFRDPEQFVRIGGEILAIPYHPREQQKGDAR